MDERFQQYQSAQVGYGNTPSAVSLALYGHCYYLAFTWIISDGKIPGQIPIHQNHGMSFEKIPDAAKTAD